MIATLKKSFWNTLLASTFFELAHLIQLFAIGLFLPKQDAGHYALIISGITLISKCIDLGGGASIPRFIKTPNLFPILFIQFIVLTLFPLPLLLYLYAPVMAFFILIAAASEALASISRHTAYSNLEGLGVAKAEILLKIIKVVFIFFIGICQQLNLATALGIFLFFLISNTTLITWQAYASMQQKKLIKLACFSSLYSYALHKEVLLQRLQLFSTKLGRELCSSHALTPLFAVVNPLEATWLFYLMTRVATSIQVVIRMAIGYTAAGAFVQLAREYHQQTITLLNQYLFRLITLSITYLIVMAYAVWSEAIIPFNVIICSASFTLVLFIDLVSIVYEQFLLVTAHYLYFHQLRIIEYFCIAAAAWIATSLCNLTTILIIIICIKIIFHIILRVYALKLTKRQLTPPISHTHVSPTHA